MGETIPTWKPTCNPSVSVRLSGRKTSSDGGAFLLREVMDRSGICEQLGQQLQDHRDPSKVRHSLTSQLRTLMIQQAQGWDDLSDTQLLGEDPVFQLACSDQRSTTPLTQQRPSQPIERLGCWAHARRKFVDAQKVQPKGKTGRADVALNLIGQLYGVEKHYKTASTEERYQARQEQSLPILHKLKTWLDDTLLHATAKNKLGVALGYLASNWSKLVRYTEAGYLPIDNNAVEGDIRHFAVGRKNWLFSDTPAGADSSAIIYNLMQTAMANGKEPYAWMRYVMEQQPACQSAEQIEQLLP